MTLVSIHPITHIRGGRGYHAKRHLLNTHWRAMRSNFGFIICICFATVSLPRYGLCWPSLEFPHLLWSVYHRLWCLCPTAPQMMTTLVWRSFITSPQRSHHDNWDLSLGSFTGSTLSSISVLYSSSRQPSPVNTRPYSFFICLMVNSNCDGSFSEPDLLEKYTQSYTGFHSEKLFTDNRRAQRLQCV